jgi:galactosyl transferase GMA12/MNN10 family
VARKALATIGTGAMRPVLDQSLHTFRRFGERHGYDVVVGGEEMIADRAPAWSKVVLLRRLIERYDYVLWIDADAIILDDSDDPASLLAERHYQALVRYRYGDEECACTGVWLLRKVDKAIAFLDAVWDSGDGYLRLHPWEQAAAMRLLGYSVDPDRFVAATEWTEGTLWLGNEWDTIPAFTVKRRLTQCKIRHYARETNGVRRRQMRTDRHVLDSVSARSPAARTWHRAAALAGLTRWNLGYRHIPAAYDLARRTGLVKLVREFGYGGGSRSDASKV